MASGFPGRDSRGSYAGSGADRPFKSRSRADRTAEGEGEGRGFEADAVGDGAAAAADGAAAGALPALREAEDPHGFAALVRPRESHLPLLDFFRMPSSGRSAEGGGHRVGLRRDRLRVGRNDAAAHLDLGRPFAFVVAAAAADDGESEQPPFPLPLPSNSSSSNSTASSTASCSTPPPSNPSRQLLSDAAAAVAEGNLAAAAASLAAVRRAASPRGDAEQRLAAMMAAALASRLDPPAPSGAHPAADLFAAEHRFATQLLHDASPCFKLGLAVANLAILEAARGHPKLHVVDFDVGSGAQHAELIRALAERRPRPASLKITAVADPAYPLPAAAAKGLRDVGDRLSKLADRAGVGLRFSIVSLRAAELDRASLGCEPDEALAVNLAFVLSRIADESVSPANPRDELLRRVRALAPRAVALVEQEMSGNTAPFAARFAEACAHYGALLESLEATLGRDSADRARVEAALSRKATNTVAREGPERVERCELFGKWRARMSMAGFRPLPLGPGVAEPVRARLASTGPNPGFAVKEDAGGLGFSWMGRVLTFASAWR
uniref:Uncharacterized protein n=1 Tax=Ananas comosus var. bracteatus TaxID=296719 RepID=A0A6V7QNA8_ANACO|nr:unnamed protein product [Ananas comosus var. bracteatus]